MRLGFAFFASAAEAGPDGRFSVLGGDLDAIELPDLPARVPRMSLVAKLLFDADECGRDHCLKISLVDPSGRSLTPGIEDEIGLERPAILVPGQQFSASIVRDLIAVQFSHEGLHILHVNCDSQELGTVPLVITNAQSMASAQGGSPKRSRRAKSESMAIGIRKMVLTNIARDQILDRLRQEPNDGLIRREMPSVAPADLLAKRAGTN